MIDTNNDLTQSALKARREYAKKQKRNMTAEQKEKERAYMKEWRKNNKDKVRQNYLNFWERKGKEMAGKQS